MDIWLWFLKLKSKAYIVRKNGSNILILFGMEEIFLTVNRNGDDNQLAL
jgi:hypothetical protein